MIKLIKKARDSCYFHRIIIVVIVGISDMTWIRIRISKEPNYANYYLRLIIRFSLGGYRYRKICAARTCFWMCDMHLTSAQHFSDFIKKRIFFLVCLLRICMAFVSYDSLLISRSIYINKLRI